MTDVYEPADPESPAWELSITGLLGLLTDPENEPCIRQDCRAVLESYLNQADRRIPAEMEPLVFEAIGVPIPTHEEWEAGA